MSAYDEQAALRKFLKEGIPASMVAALTGTQPTASALVGGLGKSDGVAANVDQHIPVSASGAQEKASSVVNVGGDGTEHDFKAAAAALPHGCTPVDGGNSTASHKDDCRYWKTGDFCICGATE